MYLINKLKLDQQEPKMKNPSMLDEHKPFKEMHMIAPIVFENA